MSQCSIDPLPFPTELSSFIRLNASLYLLANLTTFSSLPLSLRSSGPGTAKTFS